MAKKVTINLNYSGEKLWWSTDGGANWGIVGPNSPVSVLQPGTEVEWKADRTIEEIDIKLGCHTVMNSVSGDKRDKAGKVKSDCKNGDKSKYNIAFTPAGAKQAIFLDPDLIVCDTECPPGEDPGEDAS